MGKRALLIISLCLLSACGFHLRGQANIPFKSMYLIVPDPNSPFVKELRRNLRFNKIDITTSAEQADMVLKISSEISDKQILTLDASGRVSEYQLRFRVTLRAYDKQQQDWIPTEEMMLYRNFTYDDTKILAKEAEENMLNQSMRSDMAQQILRRLSQAKLQSNDGNAK